MAIQLRSRAIGKRVIERMEGKQARASLLQGLEAPQGLQYTAYRPTALFCVEIPRYRGE